MCTVLLRLNPDAEWPLLLAAVRDEFVDRTWDPPAAHWPALGAGLIGGRDRTAGGTWLALRPDPPAVAALLNGPPLPLAPGLVRPSRGGLPLAVLTGAPSLDAAELANFDTFHLLRATPDEATVWSWDGFAVQRTDLAPGDHIIVNHGVDTVEDPLVPHFLPLLRATPAPPLDAEASTEQAWGEWVDLLRGDGLAGDDPRALILSREYEGRRYGSTSASLVALGRHDVGARVRFDFTATPATPSWYEATP